MKNEAKVRNEIFNFVYDIALRDATMRTAYPWSKDDEKRKEQRSKIFECDKAKKLTKHYIDSLLSVRNPCFYDTVDEIRNAFKENGADQFSFGNTQKLINMTTKYVYIAAYRESVHKEFHEKFRDCHCPMDGIVVKRVIKDIQEQSDEKQHELLKDRLRNWRGFLQNPWSKIDGDIEQYKFFQKLVKYLSDQRGIIPIEYDFIAWNSKGKNEGESV